MEVVFAVARQEVGGVGSKDRMRWLCASVEGVAGVVNVRRGNSGGQLEARLGSEGCGVVVLVNRKMCGATADDVHIILDKRISAEGLGSCRSSSVAFSILNPSIYDISVYSFEACLYSSLEVQKTSTLPNWDWVPTACDNKSTQNSDMNAKLVVITLR